MKRKHWVDYPKNHTGYGSCRVNYNGKVYVGFGIYGWCDGQEDYWLDRDCATPMEKKIYTQYLKARKFTKQEKLQKRHC